MKKSVIAASLMAVTALAGCQLSEQDRANLGLFGGAVGGFLIADAFGASTEGQLLAAAAGAAGGTLLARSTSTGDCAYADGLGGYRIAPCPR